MARRELWAIIAAYIGLVGAWRLTAVCKAAQVVVANSAEALGVRRAP